MPFEITGIDPTYKVPRFIGRIIFSSGALSAASAPLVTLYVGPKSTDGVMVADTDVTEVFSHEDIDRLAGPGSVLAWMARKGLSANKTGRHMIASYAEPVGTAATVTILLAGTPTAAGLWQIRIGGVYYQGTVLPSHTEDTLGPEIAAKLNADTRCPFSAAYSAGTNTLTLTCKNVGEVGKQWTVQVDTSKMPSGITFTVTGSASLGQSRVLAGAAGTGVGAPDVSTILTKLLNGRYARIATAASDATNAARFEDHVEAKAEELSMLYEHVIFCSSAAYATAKSLAQTTLNAVRAQVLWMPNADIHPAVVAAVKAAIRAGTENASPVPDYDQLVLPGIPAYLDPDDMPIDAEQNAALNNGLTPIVSVDGEARVVRSVTSYSLLDGLYPDFRTLDIGDAVFPDYAMLELQLAYQTDFRPSRPLVQPDPDPGELDPPANVAYPRLFEQLITWPRLRAWAAAGWIEDPDANPPATQFNSTTKRIEQQLPLVVTRVQHQLVQVIRQQAG
jgi:phage tail sheath gpL-like